MNVIILTDTKEAHKLRTVLDAHTVQLLPLSVSSRVISFSTFKLHTPKKIASAAGMKQWSSAEFGICYRG